MENYTVTKLSEIFQTTRSTVYSKLKDTSIEQYLDTDEKGTKTLRPEGFTQFQLIMANSRVGHKQETIQEVNTQETNKVNTGYQENYIRSLHDQIDLLKQQNERLLDEKAEMSKKYDNMFDVYMILTKPQARIEEFKTEEPKKSIFDKLFKK